MKNIICLMIFSIVRLRRFSGQFLRRTLSGEGQHDEEFHHAALFCFEKGLL